MDLFFYVIALEVNLKILHLSSLINFMKEAGLTVNIKFLWAYVGLNGQLRMYGT